ncbi:MAG: DNA alkylation repair protein [Chloroflexi bacterium]|nr:DNA alkylation repair protein [Chloroflexota bacterium]MYD17965.1 DNA alkylation repair protein [Chloroflexota bacterium]MYJ01305.1 DNA alkylation repair protein [Chloroflexota bacterium]
MVAGSIRLEVPTTMAKLEQVLAELEAAGTAQNRKVYARHGAAQPMFGVSYKELGRISKPLKTDHALAVDLWHSGNHDARVLALRIADPSAVTEELALDWLADVNNYILVEGLGKLVAQSPAARTVSDQLRDHPQEWPASLGWFIVACSAEQPELWTFDELEALVQQINTEIDARPNRVRHEMNGALIAIGLRGDGLRSAVLATASQVCPVEVNHGETGCKTPDVAPYIERTLARRAAQAARRAERARAKAAART